MTNEKLYNRNLYMPYYIVNKAYRTLKNAINTYDITYSNHAIARGKERNISLNCITKNMLLEGRIIKVSMIKNKINKITIRHDLNKKNDVFIVIGFNNGLNIITLIKRKYGKNINIDDLVKSGLYEMKEGR